MKTSSSKNKPETQKSQNYAHFIVEEHEDKKQKLRTDVIKSVSKKIKGEQPKKQTKRQKFIDEESEKIIIASKSVPEKQSTYESAEADMLNLKQYKQSKMAMLDLQISGSSQEELEPTLMKSQDIIAIAFGQPEPIQFYFIIFAQSDSNTVLDPKIKIIKSLKIDKPPQISIVLTVKSYTIYKVEYTSLIQKYSIQIPIDNMTLALGDSPFDSKDRDKLSFNKGYLVDCLNRRKTALKKFQQIVIFSLLPQTQLTIKQELQKFNCDEKFSLNISNELVEAVVCYQNNKEFLYELMLNVVEKWNIQSQDLSSEQMLIYQLITKSYIKQCFNPFNKTDNKWLKKTLLTNLINSICCKSHQILEKQEKEELAKKILNEVTSKKDFITFSYFLQKVFQNSETLLLDFHTQQSFHQNLINVISNNAEQKLALEVFSAVYYISISEKTGKKIESVVTVINAISPIKAEVNVKFPWLVKFVSHLSQILKSKQKFSIASTQPQNIFKLLQLYPTFLALNNFDMKPVNTQIKDYLTKTLGRKGQDLQNSDYPFLISQQVFFNKTLQKQILGENYTKQFTNVVVTLLTTFKADEAILIKITSCFILQAIKQGINIDTIADKYVSFLKQKNANTAFRILSCGNTDIQFSQEKFQQVYSGIISKITKFFVTQFNFYQDWQIQKYCFLVNEQILRKMMYLAAYKYENIDNLQLQKIYKQIEHVISLNSKQQDLQKLKVIILQPTMTFDPQSIISNLKKREKLYLKLLLKVLKNQKKKEQVTHSLLQVTSKLETDKIPYSDLELIVPTSTNDKQKFSQLFSSQLLTKVQQSIKCSKKKIVRLQKIKQFVNIIKNKFQISEEQAQKPLSKISEIEQTIKTLVTSEVKKLEILPNFSDQIISFYEFPFFFKEFQPNLNSIDAILKAGNLVVTNLKNKLITFLKSLQNNQLCCKEYSDFGFQNLNDLQLKSILEICGVQNSQQEMKAILRVINFKKLSSFYKQISQSLIFFCSQDQQYQQHNKKLQQVFNFCQEFQNINTKSEKIKLQQFQTNISMMESLLKQLKLSLSEEASEEVISHLPLSNIYIKISQMKHLSNDSSILFTLQILNQRKQALLKLKQMKNSISAIQQCSMDNPQQSFNISFFDFRNFKFIINDFLEKSEFPNIKSLKKLIETIKQFEKKINANEDDFNTKLIRLTNLTTQFQQGYNLLKNPAFGQTMNINKLIENSRIEVNWIKEPYGYELKVFAKTGETEKQFSISQLSKFKDMAHMAKGKTDRQQNTKQKEETLRKVDKFLQMYSTISEMDKTLTKMKNQGYMVFADKKESVTVEKQNLENIEKKFKQIKQGASSWSQSVNSLHGLAFESTMLKGSKLRQLFEASTLPNQQSNYQKFRHVVKPQKHKQILSQLAQKNIQFQPTTDPVKAVNFMNQYFSTFQTIKEKQTKPAPDREEQYVSIIRISSDISDQIIALDHLQQGKLKNLKEGQIFTCTKETTSSDLEMFMSRSIRDPDNQYVLLSYDTLDKEKEDLVISMIDESMMKGNNKMKLCAVSQANTHKIYRYVANNMRVIKRLEGSSKVIKELGPQFKEIMHQRFFQKNNKYGRVTIYSSAYPGLGKTFTILNQIASLNLQPIFYPISGRLSTQSLLQRLKTEATGKTSFSLIIQIYEIEKDSIDIINDFLRQLVIFRMYQNSNDSFCLPDKTKMYFEIQDQRMKDEVNGIPFLKWIIKNFPQVMKRIDNFSMKNYEYKVGNKKLSYVLEHLLKFDTQTLDSSDLPAPETYTPTKLVEKHVEMLTKYYLVPYCKIVQQPTFYQLNYWINLFYESCCSFTGFYGISSKYLQNEFIPTLRQTFPTLDIAKIRSEFFKVLIDNSVTFLAFSVIDLLKEVTQQQSQESKQKQRLKQIPLLIIPNNKLEWFSFISKKFDQLPTPVRVFLGVQELATQRQLGTIENAQKVIAQRIELQEQPNQDKAKYEEKLQKILKDISGNMSYKIANDPGYVLNIDNFMKICLIFYKMKVHIPLVIQGEAGIGKTALLRHLIEHVFQYKFISHTINVGVTQQSLKDKIESARVQYDMFQIQNSKKENQHKQKKVCIFLDEFNTLPELGYIKELMMENRFLGRSTAFFQKLIVFAACNPYRFNKNAGSNKENEKKDQSRTLAFTVKRPPLSIGQIMWNFGSLNQIQMNKYISRMLKKIDSDLPNSNFVQLICQIQKSLNTLQWGCVSLRDVERFRQIYTWLTDNLPNVSVANKPRIVEKYYSNKSLRAFIISLSLTYFNRADKKQKLDQIKSLVNGNSTTSTMNDINYNTMGEFKKFQENDFAERIQVNFEGISLNSALKENLYCIFICVMKCIPVIIVGNPGSSKSLAYRIICNTFSSENKNNIKDQWLKCFQKIAEYFFQGSETCTSIKVQKRFKLAQQYAENNSKNITNKQDMNIPLFIFDQIGLAERSPDNPLKAIHQPLQLTMTNKQNKRQVAFLGISNTNLDSSKMSRLLILRRPALSLQDLQLTAKEIFKSQFVKDKIQFNHINIYPCLNSLSQTYSSFIPEWQECEKNSSETIKNFYGLRDFYSLIRTLADLIKAKIKTNLLDDIIDQCCDLSIHRNFNGHTKGLQLFKSKYFSKIKRHPKPKQYDLLQQMKQCLLLGSRRFPLIIVPDSLSEATFCYCIQQQFQEAEKVIGSSFQLDLTESEPLMGCITQIMNLAASENKMIAMSLNKTVEGAFFDLFNKFFMKRENLDVYRIATVDGLTVTSVYNPKFNAVFVMSREDTCNESSAFLNRFAKYDFNFQSAKFKNVEALTSKILRKLKKIQQMCKHTNLGHYQLPHLFLNFSERTLKSLVWKLSYSLKTNQQIQEACIKNLSYVTSKDFDYIINLVLCKNNQQQKNEQLETLKQIKKSLKQKKKALDQCELAILLTTDSKNDNTKYSEKMVSVEVLKKQADLIKQISQYITNETNKLGALVINFTRQEGMNLNDSSSFFDADKIATRIQLSYVMNTIRKCKAKLNLQNKPVYVKKVRIILNYDRKHSAQFTELSFMSQYSIFSLDGESGSFDKAKIFENVRMKPLIQNCLQNYKLEIEQLPQDNQTKQLIKQFTKELTANGSAFAQCCKDAMQVLQGGNISVSDDNIRQCLQNPKYLQQSSSICTILTKQYFQQKCKYSIATLLTSLNSEKALATYSDKVKMMLLSKEVDHSFLKQYKSSQKQCEDMRNFMIKMASQKIKKEKPKYNQKKKNLFADKQFKLKKPTYYPFSSIQTDILFSDQILGKLKKMATSEKSFEEDFKSFEQSYNNKLNQQIATKQLQNLHSSLTRSTNAYWKRMLMADILMVFCQKTKIPNNYLFFFLNQLQNQLKQENSSFLKKMIFFLGNFELWSFAFRLFHAFASGGILLQIQSQPNLSIEKFSLLFAKGLLQHSARILTFNDKGLSNIKADSLDKKVKIFISTHHLVYFQIQNLTSSGIIEGKKQIEQVDLQVTEEFLTFWEIITANDNTNLSLSVLIKNLNSLQNINSIPERIFNKIQQISNFLEDLLKSKKISNQKIVYEFLANKMFPSWFKRCSVKPQITEVYSKFLNFCQKSELFCHNSLGSIQIIFRPLNLKYQNGKGMEIIRQLRAFQPKNDIVSECLVTMGNDCQSRKYANKLSILICNIFFMNLKNNNVIIKKENKGFTIQDLVQNFETFKECVTQLATKSKPISKLFSFAFTKLYLYHFIKIYKPQDQTCSKINEILYKADNNLRFYCMKLLRLTNTAKQISQKYVKNETFSWCQLFKEQMTEQPAKQIQVPKVPSNLKQPQIQAIIQQFKSTSGSNVALLDQIVSQGSTSVGGRYTVLNFFLKYFYSLSYNVIQFQKTIIDYLVSKSALYSQQMGNLEYNIMLKYANSNFDGIYSVDKYENFDQEHFFIFNNLNWLVATKATSSPIHSLFFTNGNLNQPIERAINGSFLPCGPQNPYIVTAQTVYQSTRLNDVGIYICSRVCDYIYSIAPCGWPSQTGVCDMCGEAIGGPSHTLIRASAGGRRLISPKFVDLNGNFYTFNAYLQGLGEFWEAQRCYITAEINRMKTKKQVSWKPMINKLRVQQKLNLLGYSTTLTGSRIGSVTTKVLLFCIESSFYCFVSLDLIKPEECQILFGTNVKQQALQKINVRMKDAIKQLKKVVNLTSKFCTWVLGIQSEIYSLLINFRQKYSEHIQNLQQANADLCKRMKQKIPTINVAYHELYNDLIRVIESGFATKELKQIQNTGNMDASNQFTRDVLEQRVEQIVSTNLNQGKRKFVEQRYEVSGKMQFPFDAELTEQYCNEGKFVFSKILKVPGDTPTFDQIATKYEVLIRDHYPILDYLLTNSIHFKFLKAFNQVIKACNSFWSNANCKFTRGYCSKISTSQFVKKYCSADKINVQTFINSWKTISKDLGVIQVQCKVFGKMNDQLNGGSEIYNFLLDNKVKENYNGKIIVGIYNNFAKNHNPVVSQLRLRKNQIAKYKNINMFSDAHKFYPQSMSNDDFIVIQQKKIMDEIMKASVSSIIYGENIVYHNFDFCETALLEGLKRKQQVIQNIEEFSTIRFVGQTFSQSAQGTSITAISDVRSIADEPISKQKLDEIKEWFAENTSQQSQYKLLGELQRLVNMLSFNTKIIEYSNDQQLSQVIKSKCSNLRLQLLSEIPFSSFKLSNIIHLLEKVQQNIRPFLKPNIPQKYKSPMQPADIKQITQFIEALPADGQNLTPSKLRSAIQNYVYRNLNSPYTPQDKPIFDTLAYREDFWPKDYDIYSNANYCQAIKKLTSQYACSFMELVESLVKN